MPRAPGHFLHFKCSTPHYIVTYNLNVQLNLLNPVLKKLHIDSVAVRNWLVFPKPKPFVKWNNAEFTNASCFTLPLTRSAHFVLFGIVLAALPATILPRLCWLKSLESQPGVSCLGSLGAGCFSGHCNSSELNFFGFWASAIWELATPCRKFLYII